MIVYVADSKESTFWNLLNQNFNRKMQMNKEVRIVAHLVECLPHMLQALGLISALNKTYTYNSNTGDI